MLYVMAGVAAAAMGLQNATITRISSGAVRTTHVTGVLTDLGTETVQFLDWLRDRVRGTQRGAEEPARPGEDGAAANLLHSVQAHPSARRLALLASIVGGFALGAGLGTLAYDHLPRLAMFPPVLLLLWIIHQDVTTPIAEIEESGLVGDAARGCPRRSGSTTSDAAPGGEAPRRRCTACPTCWSGASGCRTKRRWWCWTWRASSSWTSTRRWSCGPCWPGSGPSGAGW